MLEGPGLQSALILIAMEVWI